MIIATLESNKKKRKKREEFYFIRFLRLKTRLRKGFLFQFAEDISRENVNARKSQSTFIISISMCIISMDSD